MQSSVQSAGRKASATPLRGSRGSATASAASKLRDCIVSGEIEPGARILERSMCERLGVSRTPLREALKILETEGFVTISPNRGAVVVDLSLDVVEATFEVLAGLEARAAELACSRMMDAELDAIARLHAAMVAHHRDGRLLDYFHANQAIHDAIVDAAKNPVLARIYRAESRRIWRYRYATNQYGARWDSAVREHHQILSALRARDAALLRELVRAHLMAGWLVARQSLIESRSNRSVAAPDAIAGR